MKFINILLYIDGEMFLNKLKHFQTIKFLKTYSIEITTKMVKS
jgi:hypothetical protein